MLRNVKSPLPVDMRRSKMPLLKFPGDIACLPALDGLRPFVFVISEKFERQKTSKKIIYSLI